MSFNFPNSPTEGTTFTPVGGYQYLYTNGTWRVVESPQVRATAEARNRIVNGAFNILQEGSPTITTSGGYVADQWARWHSSSAGVLTGQRVSLANYTSKGSGGGFRMTITTPDAALAAGEYLSMGQPLEGVRMKEFMWGYATARQIVVRFGFRGPAGTYAMAITNGPSEARSYVAPFTISAGQANTEVEQTFVVPGDTTGTWLGDTSLGAYFYVVLAAGTTYQGVAGWQTGPKYATAAISNGMGTGGAIFELTDVGLYLDPDATGLAPKWTMPDEAQELAACMRYYQYYGTFISSGIATAGSQTIYTNLSIPPMRVAPAINAGSPANSNSGGFANSGTIPNMLRVSCTSTAAGVFYAQAATTLSARM